MLKYFYKTLFVSILCGSLLLLDFSYKGSIVQFNTTVAETVKTEGIKDNDLMSTLTMSAIGLLTQRLWMCQMSTDMMLAAGGGAAYVAGEVLAFFKLKKAMKDIETEITRNKNGEIDQKQIDTLVKLKESYQKAKETANTKKMLQTAAAAAFAAAAVAAYMLEATEQAQFATCNAAAASVPAECQELSAASAAVISVLNALQASRIIPKPSAAAKAASETGQTAVTTGGATTASSGTTIAVAAGTACTASEGTDAFHCKEAVTCGPSGAKVMAACSPIQITLKGTEGFCPSPLSFAKTNSAPSKSLMANNALGLKPIFLALIGRYLVSDAKADLFSPLGIASSAAISFMLATNKTLGATIDFYLLAPINRAVIWGVLAGLTFMASSSTGNQISKIESNIQKIDSIINGMRSFQNGVAQSKTPGVQNPRIGFVDNKNQKLGFNESERTDIDLKADGGGKLPCVNGEESQNCPSLSNKLLSQPDLRSMPDSVQAAATSLGKLTDGLNGTGKISSGTIAEANSLSGRLNALQSDIDKRRKEAQDRLKAAGSKLDLEAQAKKVNGEIRSAVETELNKRNMTAGQMLASFGSHTGAGSFGGGAEGTVASDVNKNGKGAKKGAGTFVMPVVAVPPAGFPQGGADKSLSDSLKADQGKADELASAADGKAGDSIDDFDLKNDITKEKDTSIFDLISNRYQKSGYPRLFKRIK